MSIVPKLMLLAPLLGMLAGVGVGRAQFSAPALPQATSTGNPDFERGGVIEPSMARDMQQRQLKKLREQHQREVISDTERMVALASAMKDEVDKGNKTLNADVMKDADEIARLAKRVSERIKTQ